MNGREVKQVFQIMVFFNLSLFFHLTLFVAASSIVGDGVLPGTVSPFICRNPNSRVVAARLEVYGDTPTEPVLILHFHGNNTIFI